MFFIRIFQYLIGMTIIYFATTLAVKSTIGAGFWSALFVGLSDSLPFSVGVWFATSQILIVFINACLLKGKPELLAFIPILLESIIFDFWLEVVFRNIHFTDFLLITRIGIFMLALMIAGFGIALYIMTGYPRSPVDQLFIAISYRFKWKVGASQTLVALTVSVVAFLLGGPVGAGTILSVFLLGPCIQFWMHKIDKVKILKHDPSHAHAS